MRSSSEEFANEWELSVCGLFIISEFPYESKVVLWSLLGRGLLRRTDPLEEVVEPMGALICSICEDFFRAWIREYELLSRIPSVLASPGFFLRLEFALFRVLRFRFSVPAASEVPSTALPELDNPRLLRKSE